MIVKEHEEIKGLSDKALKRCIDLADNPPKAGDKDRRILSCYKSGVKARNYVGVLPVADTIIEILPKVDLSDNDIRGAFCRMLPCYRHISNMATVPEETDIRKLKEYDMLEVFMRLFLQNLLKLVKAGIVSQYHEHEDNLPYMKGRLHFTQHIRENIVNKARFYVRYDEYSPNHAANRLIRTVLQKMRCKERKNRQLRGQLDALFEAAPPSKNIQRDLQHWKQHRFNRNTLHYKTVMPWVELFLSFYGLTTFAGKHTTTSLLFPMEEVFEDFVGYHFEQHAKDWEVKLQKPQISLMENEAGKPMFAMKPDIHMEHKSQNKKLILDTKWKHIDEREKDKEIKQDDLYQLFAYGRVYGANPVVLIYPQNENFTGELKFTYQDKGNPLLRLICCPFDVEKPEKSVDDILKICKGGKNPTVEKTR